MYIYIYMYVCMYVNVIYIILIYIYIRIYKNICKYIIYIRATTPEERDKLQLEANELSQPKRDEEETALFYAALGDLHTCVYNKLVVGIVYITYTYIYIYIYINP
jgi:hypothetical protein